MVPARHTIFANRASDSIYWRHSPFANFSETPCKVALAYEDLGEHTDAILHELGYPPEDVRRLEDEGVIYRGLRTETGV
jgi:crotonobetainyl-CoA:carnitine CoA-transferase CaiB-like acyl-CoA transferase